MSEKYPSVFRKLDIGKVTIPNRIAFPAFQFNYANTDGSVSEKLLSVHNHIAQGGCGLIITGCAAVSEKTLAFDRVLRIDSNAYKPGLKKFFTMIESHGTVPGIQIVHYGRQALNSVTGYDLIAPSAIFCPLMSQFDPNYLVREMTAKDIESVRSDFITAAERAADAGAKLVEVHAAHGYLLSFVL